MLLLKCIFAVFLSRRNHLHWQMAEDLSSRPGCWALHYSYDHFARCTWMQPLFQKGFYSAKHGITFSPRSGFQARCSHLPPIFWQFRLFPDPPHLFGWHRWNGNISHCIIYVSLKVSQQISLSLVCRTALLTSIPFRSIQQFLQFLYWVSGLGYQYEGLPDLGWLLRPKSLSVQSASTFLFFVLTSWWVCFLCYFVLICMQRRWAFEELVELCLCLQNLTNIYKSQAKIPKP